MCVCVYFVDLDKYMCMAYNQTDRHDQYMINSLDAAFDIIQHLFKLYVLKKD